MFRDNKREIFGFRKYKAYGLASAVIAAFFLMGGVASADEVTKPTTSDVAAHVVTSSTEVSADTVASSEEVAASNTAVENTVANTAAETPVVASGESASANTATGTPATETTATTATETTATPATETTATSATETTATPAMETTATPATNTKINGEFVITGTNSSEKHLTKTDRVNGAYMLEGTYTFTSSGTDTVTGAQLVYESDKAYLGEPKFSRSVLVAKMTDKSDQQTWRYVFDLTPIGGATMGQISVTQKSQWYDLVGSNVIRKIVRKF